jgi:hypothetical protein
MINAPFSEAEVNEINDYQKLRFFHPLTCGDVSDKCERRNRTGEGLLTAEQGCLTCPCGEYKQTWVPSLPSPNSFIELNEKLNPKTSKNPRDLR